MSLRFHGNPTAEVDRVKVPIDPQVAADLGGDLTVEFWLKTEPDANPSSSCQAGSDGWTYGNVILDRDVFGTGDYGEYGVSLSGGRIAFGVGRGGRQQTICGLIDVADGRWHHVAVTRRAADGVMRIYVDGTESAQGIGPAGDISYRDGRPTGVSSDPFLVVGASKADDGASGHGFSGALDELRLSSSIRYSSPFDRRSRRSRPTPRRRCCSISTKGRPAPASRASSTRRDAPPTASAATAARRPPVRSTRPTRRFCRRGRRPGSSERTVSPSPSCRPTARARRRRPPAEGTPGSPSEPPPTPNIR